jgi:hypothetical protein
MVERKVSQVRVGSAWVQPEQAMAGDIQGEPDWLRKVVDPELIELIRKES